MNKIIKISAFFLTLIMLFNFLLACGKQGLDNSDGSDSESGSDIGIYSDSDSLIESDDSLQNDFDSTEDTKSTEKEDEMTEEEKLAAQKKKEENDKLLAAFKPTYETLRNNIKNKKSGYDFGTEDKSIGTPNSGWTAQLPKITEAHPRLLLTAKTVPTIRKALKEDNPTNKRYYQFIDADISTINKGVLGEAKTDFDGRKGKHNYNKAYLEFIQIKALGYLVEGHDLYGYQAVYCMKEYLRTLDIQYISSNMEREYGNVMFTAALVYDWCYKILTAEDKAQLRAGIQNKTAKGTCGYPDYTTVKHYKWKMSVGYPPYSETNMGAVSGHGSERQVLRDYLSVAIAFYGDNDSWWNYVGKLVYSEYVPVRNHYFQSGISQQGIGVYVSGRHIADMYSAWMLKTATRSQPYPNISKTVRNFLGYECSPGKLFSDGDGTFSQQNNYEFRALSYMTAYIFADAPMLAQAKAMQPTKAFEADTIELTSAMYVALSGMSDIKPASNKYQGMELIQYNGSPVGQYVTHEAWNDANSANVFMKIKELSSANHEHADAGNFMIYYKGMLTADTGVYSGYGSDHTRYYHQATISHNSLLVDNGSQNKSSSDKKIKFYSGGQIWPAEISGKSGILNIWKNSKDHQTGKIIGNAHGYYDTAKTKPKYAYLGGDITGAYPSSTVDFVGRRMLVVYTGDEKVPMAFFVYDSITSDSTTYKKTFLLHTYTEPTISGKTVSVVNGNGKLVLNCLSNATISKVGGRTLDSAGMLNDSASKNYYIHGYGQVPINYDDDSWGRVEITSSGDKTTRFLNAMYVTDKSNTTSYSTSAISAVSKNSLSGGDVEGCVFNKSVAAIFAKKNLSNSSSRLTGTVSFTTSGNSSMQYYVDGLASGTWQVKVGSTTVGSFTVASGSGLLTFTAPAGNVVLTKTA